MSRLTPAAVTTSPEVGTCAPLTKNSPPAESSNAPDPLAPLTDPSALAANVPSGVVVTFPPSGSNTADPLAFETVAVPSFRSHTSATASPDPASRAYMRLSPACALGSLSGSTYPTAASLPVRWAPIVAT